MSSPGAPAEMTEHSLEEIMRSARSAAASGNLLQASVENLEAYFSEARSSVALGAVAELIGEGNWAEINNRFFQTLAFGTGGLRGKSVGAVVTAAERGRPQPQGRPEFPCVGTNAMNAFNVGRATRGLTAYVKEWSARNGLTTRPALCVCHDTRFFSREFAELAARIITEMGCDARLFEGPRSTPELSFAVRATRAQAGINITASHNPPEYNGYKVYFDDGAQIVEPHAQAVIERVHSVRGEDWGAVPASGRGRIIPMGAEMDAAYMQRLETLPIEPARLRAQPALRVVYTPLHGVGGIIIKPILERLGVVVRTVAEQDVPDGRFPTVKSPNPENAEALSLAITLANAEGADLVIATDPDDDRMGVAARDASGDMVLLTGNQIGTILCWHRITRLFHEGILNAGNASRAVVVKTLMTTDLQKVIAEAHGLRCVETLTGFKYIGEKLRKYEEAIPEDLRKDYRTLSEERTRELRLTHSSFYVFGGEESYGYSGSDFVRDKDGNSAAVMLVEAAAFARAEGHTLPGLLDRIFCEYGVFLERSESLTLEGAEGAEKIRRLVGSYATHPPEALDGSPVVSVRNFAKDEILDSEGDRLPRENMLIMEFEDGRRAAVRPSGTEPKVKYYVFGRSLPPTGRRFDAEQLAAAKVRVAASLDSLWRALRADAATRA